MTAMFALRAILKAVILPPVGPALLILIGLWKFRRERIWPRVVGGLGLALLIALSLPIVADGLTRVMSAQPDSTPSATTPQVIVVLSGGIRVNAATPSGSDVLPVTLIRLATAAALARQSGLPILLSGGAVEAGPADADVMNAALMQGFGLSARFVETRSRNTRENALESARLLRAAGVDSVWLVTSAVHQPRAAAEFRALGLQVQSYPVAGPSRLPTGLFAWLPRPWALEESTAAIYEWLGRAVDPIPNHRSD